MGTTIRLKTANSTTIRAQEIQVQTVRIKEVGPPGPAGDVGSSSGDMTKAVYDTNNNGKVDTAEVAEAVAWSAITSRPSLYPPELHYHPYEPADETILKEEDIGVLVSGTSHTHDDRYYTEAEMAVLLAGKSDTGHVHDYEPADATILKDADIGVTVAAQDHNHDSRYYTEAEMDALLAAKSDTTHNHSDVYEPVDATILRQENIGSLVAAQDHNHSGTYEPVDETILREVDIGVLVPSLDHTHGDEWAAIDHNHAGVHAPVSHEHTIADIDTEAIPADRVLASLGNGSAYWKELESVDLSDYTTTGDAVALVIALS